MTNTIYEQDSLRVRVTVTDANNVAKNLTGATMSCYLGKLGALGVLGTVESVNLPAGIVDITFPAGSAEVPTSVAQLRVTISGETQTVYSEAFRVKQSVSNT